ncbi:contractile injection system tape measure protein [Bacteroides sp. GD17]|jgi:hypothetical protein|uniref:contractile injection system tape measure protein n=1 Tax=Bacteroides sp. GD17 TaxID=3139826 RepID=UPI00205AE7F0|nr:MAG TPA: hypothetical protein [Bacteriophage sp.]
MITIGTVKFDFKADDVPFARQLNGGWDAFFRTSFEEVVEEVLSAYDQPDRTVIIDSLPLDLGSIAEEEFYKQFPVRLREVLQKYCEEKIGEQPLLDTGKEGVRIVSTGRNAFETLSFFLLHGYFPFEVDQEYTNLDYLLKKVLDEEAYRFKEFLNAYGHYDFLCCRLVYQFSDEQLEQIVHIVQPSESIFVNLYVRVQIRTYDSLRRSDITRSEYRDVVWILVLAYLFAESGGHFSRKQIILHTLRGVAAHLNYSLAEMTRLLTEGLQELENTVVQLPELWSILKEIRQDIQAELWALDGDYHICLMREVVSALRFRETRKEAEYILSCDHLSGILSDAVYCRKLLQQLQEREIHQLVKIIVPQESEFVISYACLLDKHKDAGTFSGKAGSEFRLLKWEFIFAVLFSMPFSAFSRRQFVWSVLQHLAAHYNLSVLDLIHWLYADEELKQLFSSSGIFLVVQELQQIFAVGEKKEPDEIRSVEEWTQFLQTSLSIRKFIEMHTERQIDSLVIRLFPHQGEFIVGYAALLEKGHASGMLEGKAGGEFRSMKWEFIFSCFSADYTVAFHQKYFVYSVLRRIAAHYNQEVTALIGYFLHELTALLSQHQFMQLGGILKELYEEHLLPMADVSVVRSKTDKELEDWAIYLFGTDVILSGTREAYMEKWLVFFLDEKNGLFKALWKSGRMNEILLLRLVNRSRTLRNLWLRRIGDVRLLVIYRRWLSIYAALRSRFQEYVFLESLSEYLSVWVVELTATKYLSWSEQEIMDFLFVRVRSNLPHGFIVLLNKIQIMEMSERELEWIRQWQERNESRSDLKKNVMVKNAGLVLLGPYLPAMCRKMGIVDNNMSFKCMDDRFHFIFALQYLAYGEQREWSEEELYLNKIYAGINDDAVVLPRTYQLSDEDITLLDTMFDAVHMNWSKMKNTSSRALREAFILREGAVGKDDKDERIWKVKIEPKAYDVLLDSLPWGYKTQPFRWMKEVIMVEWR